MKASFVSKFKKFVASFVAACVVTTSTVSISVVTSQTVSFVSTVAFAGIAMSLPKISWAQMTTAQAAAFANTTGAATNALMLPSTSNTTSGTVTLNSTNGSINGTTLTIDQLVGAGATAPQNSTSISNATSAYGDMSTFTATSASQVGDLLSPTNSTGWSSAYKTIRGAATTNNMMTTDLRGDPSVSTVQAIATGTDPNHFLTQTGAACLTTNVVTTNSQNVFMTDPRSCDRYVGPAGCVITRITQGSSTSYPNVFTFKGNIGTGTTIALSMNTATGNSFGSTGNITTQNSNIPSQGVPFVMTDGFSTTSNVYTIGVSPLSSTQWQSINSPMVVSYTATGQDPSATFLFTPPSSSNNYTLTISAVNSATAVNYVDLSISLAQSPLSQIATQDFPPGCFTSANCTAQPIAWTSSGAGLDLASNNTWACNIAFAPQAGDPVLPALFPGEPPAVGAVPVCYKATARNEFCSSPMETNTSTCGYLDSNTACHLVSTSCLPQNFDPVTGLCLIQTEKWDCGTNVSIDTPVSTPVTTCGGTIQCLGSNCITEPPKEVNNDFAEAAAQLSAIQFMNQDKDCSSGVCEVFKGEGFSCKIVFWGVQNCCDKPTGASLNDYIKLTYFSASQIDKKAAIETLKNAGLDVSGAMSGLQNWASTTYSEISQPIVSAWQSLTSRGSTAVIDPATNLIQSGATSDLTGVASTTLSQTMQNGLRDWTTTTFGPEASVTLFGSANPMQAANFSGTAIGGLASTLYMIYSYYMIAVLIISLIWACDDQEMALAVKKDMRMCHDLGEFCSADFLGVCYERKQSYCCFKNPLGRIMQEQIRRVSGLPWPESSSSPSCPGLTIDQVANADYSQVDLSEWIAILQNANVMPTAANAASMLNMNSVTSDKSPTGIKGNNSLVNADIATTGTNGSSTQQFVKNQLWATLP